MLRMMAPILGRERIRRDIQAGDILGKACRPRARMKKTSHRRAEMAGSLCRIGPGAVSGGDGVSARIMDDP